jgi:hypothetical protein
MSLYGHAIASLEKAAKSLATGDIASAATGLGFPRLVELLGQSKA